MAQTREVNLTHAPFRAHVVNKVVGLPAFANKSQVLEPLSNRAMSDAKGCTLFMGPAWQCPVVERLPLQLIRCKTIILVAVIKNSFEESSSEWGINTDLNRGACPNVRSGVRRPPVKLVETWHSVPSESVGAADW